MKIIKKLIIFVLLLPLFVVFGLYVYGTYMRGMIESKEEALNKQQQALSTSGNGFGGEPGMIVIGSKYTSSNFFWMGNEHLIFYTDYSANDARNNPRNFIWNVIDNEIKPIIIDGGVICFNEGKIYHAKFSDTEVLPDGRKKVERFESELNELSDKWEVKNSRDVEKVWPAPSDRYKQLFGHACKPSFELKPEFRAESDGQEYRLKYLREWGWILRLPPIGYEFSDQDTPDTQFGFFEIEESFYYGQQGVKVADLPDLPLQDFDLLAATYMPDVDVYLLTLSIHNSERRPYVAVLNPDGSLSKVDWDKGWKDYIARPVLSRKGFVWSGRDYHLSNPGPDQNGSFIRISENTVHKYLHGTGRNLVLSPDGCLVAQSNRPKTTTGQKNLVVFDICNSIHGEMQ